MCYAVYISTDSEEDLTRHNSDLVRFEKVTDPRTDPCTRLLEFPYQWYVGSKSTCSCTFRHLPSIDLGFAEPLNWYPEEEQELSATKELYHTLANLVSSGHQVDLLDRWAGAEPQDINMLEVFLDEVSETAFRMFENHKFILKTAQQRVRGVRKTPSS